MCVNFANVLVFFLLMVELVGYCTAEFGVSKTLAALPNTAYVVSALIARIALAPNGIVFLLAAAFLGVGVGVTQSVVQAVVARESPAAEQGRANSTFMMGLDVGSGFGPMILGAVLELLTYREMYLALSVIAAATIVIYYFAHGRKAAKRRN